MDYKKALTLLQDKYNDMDIFCTFRKLGYTQEIICKKLELSSIGELNWRAIPVYRMEQLQDRSQLSCIIDMFLLQGILTDDEFETLFDDGMRAALLDSGIVRNSENGYGAMLSCYPVGERLYFADHAWPKLPHPGILDVSHDQVMYIGTDSRWLADSIIGGDYDNALDLCTGSGIQALTVARHAKQVTAVDINPRAVECARLNAYLGSAPNMQVLQGDLYGPVGEAQFDFISANPPFVPAPANKLGYRDGGKDGEEVQRRIVEALPKRLKKGGVAQIVTELGETRDGTLIDRLRDWLEGAPMDILVLRIRNRDVADYAISHADGDGTYGEFFDSVHEWAANLKSHGYASMSSVVITIKWSEGQPWGRIEDVLGLNTGADKAISAMFEAENTVRRADFVELLRTKKLRHAGKIALLEAAFLDDVSHAHTRLDARLIDSAISSSKWLSVPQLEILSKTLRPIGLSDLAASCAKQEGDLMPDIAYLVQNGLLALV